MRESQVCIQCVYMRWYKSHVYEFNLIIISENHVKEEIIKQNETKPRYMLSIQFDTFITTQF